MMTKKQAKLPRTQSVNGKGAKSCIVVIDWDINESNTYIENRKKVCSEILSVQLKKK